MSTLECWLQCGEPLAAQDAVWILPPGALAGRVNEDGVRILDEQEVPPETDGAVPLHRDCWRAWQEPPEAVER